MLSEAFLGITPVVRCVPADARKRTFVHPVIEEKPGPQNVFMADCGSHCLYAKPERGPSVGDAACRAAAGLWLGAGSRPTLWRMRGYSRQTCARQFGWAFKRFHNRQSGEGALDPPRLDRETVAIEEREG